MAWVRVMGIVGLFFYFLSLSSVDTYGHQTGWKNRSGGVVGDVVEGHIG